MSYFSEWNRRVEDTTDQGAYNVFVQEYYDLESNAYRMILENYPEAEWSGTAKDLADRLKFKNNMIIFLGFLEGINPSLKESINLDEVTDDTELNLDIDFETLYYKMHEAKAKWLFDMDAWDHVLPTERREEIAKQYRIDNIAVSNKVGRNEPCPCGSGKKYKKCCGAKSGQKGGDR
ncbi:MAG: SEC-C metal-binding domain-containing protein [Fastidiosipilaceae bacterium]|jgi:hypothetical protein|nr:SEC-C domain-containing protein [Clostridiaceae bacterium]